MFYLHQLCWLANTQRLFCLAKLEVETVGFDVIRIKGAETNRYICFNTVTSKVLGSVSDTSLFLFLFC